MAVEAVQHVLGAVEVVQICREEAGEEHDAEAGRLEAEAEDDRATFVVAARRIGHLHRLNRLHAVGVQAA